MFEQCPCIGWALLKTVLKCFLPKGKSDEEAKKEEGSRSNHQRLQAIELLASLIKSSEKDAAARALIAENISLMTNVICKVVQTSETWQNKKVKKTGLCVNLFVKAARVCIKDKSIEGDAKEQVIQEGAKLVREL